MTVENEPMIGLHGSAYVTVSEYDAIVIGLIVRAKLDAAQPGDAVLAKLVLDAQSRRVELSQGRR